MSDFKNHGELLDWLIAGKAIEETSGLERRYHLKDNFIVDMDGEVCSIYLYPGCYKKVSEIMPDNCDLQPYFGESGLLWTQPTGEVRWFVKDSGGRVLQQCWIRRQKGKPDSFQWEDVTEERENGDKETCFRCSEDFPKGTLKLLTKQDGIELKWCKECEEKMYKELLEDARAFRQQLKGLKDGKP